MAGLVVRPGAGRYASKGGMQVVMSGSWIFNGDPRAAEAELGRRSIVGVAGCGCRLGSCVRLHRLPVAPISQPCRVIESVDGMRRDDE
jgi:hypothetical protein